MAAVTLPPPAKPILSPARPAPTARRGASQAPGRRVEPDDASRDPDALRSRVWERFCEGWRAPDIASDECIPERTTRRWIASMRDEIYADLPDMRATQFAAAIDGLRALLAESWDAYRAERDIDEAYHAYAYTEMRAGFTADLKALSSSPPPQRRSNAPRYLALALQTQREIVRLLSLQQANPAALTTPKSPPTSIPAISATSAPHTAQSAATNGRAPGAAPAPPTENPATSATSAASATPPPQASTPPLPAGAGSPSLSQSGHGGARQRDGDRRDKAAIPAKTATLAARHRSKQRGPILLPKQHA